MGHWRITRVVLGSQLCFGKHAGKTIQWLIDNELKYVTWALKNGVLIWDTKRRGPFGAEAKAYYDKALAEYVEPINDFEFTNPNQ
jgi:hypothetical protein